MIQSLSARNAKSYFSDALAETDYYLNTQELAGRFHGRISERLALGEMVTKDAFFKLCDNLHPFTGQALTPRTKNYRTIGYDINFHCPKSVSALNAFSSDSHILDAFQQSVYSVMNDIQADAMTRVRKNGKDEDRETGELIWAEFVHLTSRPMDGCFPDPHLHSHCFCPNITFDPIEQQYKAVQYRYIKRDMPYYEARFNKILSDKLIALGYQIRFTKKSFEIEGVPQEVIDLFSKRTKAINRFAAENNITDQQDLDRLGARTRGKKLKDISMSNLIADWRKQVDALQLDKSVNRPIRYAPKPVLLFLQAEQCLDHAISHCFERASVMAERRVLETAYRFAMGNETIAPSDIDKAYANDVRFLKVSDKNQVLCTTTEVLAEEQRLVALALKPKGSMLPIYSMCPALAVSGEPAEALNHLLTTTDRITIIKGKAGTGKTTLLQEAKRHIDAAGIPLLMVAPTAEASRGVLRREGFEDAETVAKLLSSPELQKLIEGGIIWGDEAGLLGTKELLALGELAEEKNARLILSGDDRQHSSVSRGDALKLLIDQGQIVPCELSTIYRQKNETYKNAVYALAAGNIPEGFSFLNAMGAIRPMPDENPYQQIAEDYYSALKRKKTVLLVSPTHLQGEKVTVAVREKLKKEKRLGKKETGALKLSSLSFTDAEKSDWRNYVPSQIVKFNQNLAGIKRGSSWSILSVAANSIQMVDEQGNERSLPLDQSQRFDVFHASEIDIAKGELIRVNRNGYDCSKRLLGNGQVFKVRSVNKQGNIHCENTISKAKYVLPQNYGHIAYAYCITSHASQGKTVDEAIIIQPASTFTATNAKQFYVSVSRARENVSIYTDCPYALLQAASDMGNRLSALELMKINFVTPRVPTVKKNEPNSKEVKNEEPAIV